MTKAKNQKKIIEFFSSYKSIAFVLIIVSIFLLVFNMYLVKSINVYVFGGSKDDFIILDGSIYTGFDINRFTSPSIVYTGNDVTVNKYKIGYYIGEKEISVLEDENEVNLYSLIRTYEFGFTETHKKAYLLSKENVKNLDNLHFKVEAETTNGDKIDVDIPLTVNKISK